MFLEGETVVLNNLAKNGLPNRVGERCVIEESLYNSPNYDYRVVFDDGEFAKVKELELNKVGETDKELMEYIYTGNTVLHKSSGEIVKVLKPDYLFGQAEIEFLDDGANLVVMVDSLEAIEKENDSVKDTTEWRMVEQPNEPLETIQEEMLKMFFSQYRNNDDTYTVPKIVLVNMLTHLYEEVK